jgi:hypothetical protein
MNIKNTKKNKGFVILFAVMLSSILLAISLGVSNISFREVSFSTSAKDANDAFFAADTGVECALVNDKEGSTSFTNTSSMTIECLGQPINLGGDGISFWTFDIVGLGSNGRPCAQVRIDKDTTLGTTIIVSKGYSSDNQNIDDTVCTPTSNSLERQLEVTY